MTTKAGTAKPADQARAMLPYVGKRVRVVAAGGRYGCDTVVVGELLAIGLRIDQKRPYVATISDDKNNWFTVSVSRIKWCTKWSGTAAEGGHLSQVDTKTGEVKGTMYLGD